MSLFGHPLAAPSSVLSGFTDLTSLVATTATSAGLIGLLELATIVAIVARAFLQADRDPLLAGFAVALLAMFVALLTTPLITNFEHFFWLAMAVVAHNRSLSAAGPTFEEALTVRHVPGLVATTTISGLSPFHGRRSRPLTSSPFRDQSWRPVVGVKAHRLSPAPRATG